jgi:hypothetical protein
MEQLSNPDYYVIPTDKEGLLKQYVEQWEASNLDMYAIVVGIYGQPVSEEQNGLVHNIGRVAKVSDTVAHPLGGVVKVRQTFGFCLVADYIAPEMWQVMQDNGVVRYTKEEYEQFIQAP